MVKNTSFWQLLNHFCIFFSENSVSMGVGVTWKDMIDISDLEIKWRLLVLLRVVLSANLFCIKQQIFLNWKDMIDISIIRTSENFNFTKYLVILYFCILLERFFRNVLSPNHGNSFLRHLHSFVFEIAAPLGGSTPRTIIKPLEGCKAKNFFLLASDVDILLQSLDNGMLGISLSQIARIRVKEGPYAPAFSWSHSANPIWKRTDCSILWRFSV